MKPLTSAHALTTSQPTSVDASDAVDAVDVVDDMSRCSALILAPSDHEVVSVWFSSQHDHNLCLGINIYYEEINSKCQQSVNFNNLYLPNLVLNKIPPLALAAALRSSQSSS